MNKLNPYAGFLGTGEPMPVIRQTPGGLRSAIGRHRAAGTLDQPWTPGKWTPRQVLAHLTDTEIVFAMRLRQAAAEEHHVIQPFDQDAWARGYASACVDTALALFDTLRQWNVQFIEAQPAEMFDRPVTHPERGTMTFRTILETMAGHDLNHLQQIGTVRS